MAIDLDSLIVKNLAWGLAEAKNGARVTIFMKKGPPLHGTTYVNVEVTRFHAWVDTEQVMISLSPGAPAQIVELEHVEHVARVGQSFVVRICPHHGPLSINAQDSLMENEYDTWWCKVITRPDLMDTSASIRCESQLSDEIYIVQVTDS